MKYIRNFKIFESSDDDEDTQIYPGFEHSFADIKDTLYDILDLGFEIKERSHMYWSEDFNRERLTDAKWAVWEFKLESNIECETLTKHYSQRFSGNSQRMLLNNSNLELEVLQSVADIRARFGNVYHRLELKSDYSDKGWLLFITIMNEIDSEEISKAKTRQKESQIKDKIYDKINNLSKKIRNIGTPKFQSLSKKNKLGETSWSGLGKISEGYICIFINTTEMTKQVKKSIEQVEDDIVVLKNWFLPKGSKIELRKFTTQDCQRLSKIHGEDQKYFEDRYLDLDGVFIEYNYEKWYNDLKNEES